MQNASSPERTSVQFVCQNRDVTTMTSGCSPTAFISGGAEQLRRLEKGLDLRGRLLLRGVERLLAAVDPDHGHLGLQARLDVVVVAGGDVDPALLAPDPPLGLLEVRRVRLVGADLLRGHHEVEVRLEVAPRLAEQLVVDVGDEPDLELLAEAIELRVGLLERRPALDRVRQEAGAGRLEGPAELLGDLDGGPAQDLGVELVGPALDLLLRLHEERDQLVAGERVAVFLGFLGECVVDTRLPVDQGAVDVERDVGDFLGERHRRRSIVTACARARPQDMRRAGSSTAHDAAEATAPAAMAPSSGPPAPTPTSKNAKNVPDAAPRSASGTPLSASSPSAGTATAWPAPATTAPASASGSEAAAASSASPTPATVAAPASARRGPSRSGSAPPSVRSAMIAIAYSGITAAADSPR